LRSEHPEPIEEIKAKILGEGRWEGEIVHTRKDGTRIAVTSLQVLHRDERGEPTAILEVNNDVTERNLAQRALAESEERYRHLVELSPEAVMVHSEGEVVYANEAAARLIGAASSAELIGKPIMGFAHPDYREMAVERIREAFATGEPIPLREEKIVFLDGAVIDVEVTGVPIVYDGKPAIQLLARDIRERKQAAEALRRSEERFRSLVQNSSDVVSVIGADGTAQYVSPSIERVLGYNPEDAIGNSVFEPLSVHPDDVARVRSAFAELFAKGRGASIADELRLRHADGSWRYIEAIGKNLVDDPSVGGIVVNYRDVTERKAFEKHLEHKAFHDDLTNLPNRALFVDRLEEALARLDRSEDKAAAVLFMDLDNFKVVNDSLGHVAGDQLLVAVAGRLRSGMRPGDTVARFGGDEFAVLLEGVEGASDAVKVAERILKELQPPFALGGREVFALPSIGISLGTTASNRAEDLLRGADTALYEVKARGKAGYALFDPSMHDKALKRLRTESDLRRALENGEFRVYYQPKMRLSTDIRHSLRSSGSQAIVARKRETKQIPRIEGTEALVRWEHPEMGLISPDEFISVAEETGLIVQLGRWVLEEACLQTRRWNELYPGDPPLTVCVNLSGRQFQDPGLAQDVARILQETGLNPQCLNLEITESVLMEDARSTIATLLELKYLGVELSIDDFGTGYSSLSYLKRFPVDHLKIDRSFVGELKKDAEDTMLVSGIIRLAHTMGMRVVAEGVESAEQMQRLQGLGCDLAQGYYLSEPLPGEAVPGFLAHDQQRSKS
jgi:diguanylate cyclase (GGDEF)-like protein/PAS domain S-box-containing protein